MHELIAEMKHRIQVLDTRIEHCKGQQRHHTDQAAIYAEEIEAGKKLSAQYSEAIARLIATAPTE